VKILELRFRNLNSLYGEWRIDLTDPEYTSNGIFALTGPTGAGKSTILDAICLALYGATPRLGKITKAGNEIMSRQTGECYAEVLFESQAGRFRCHWEQRRARKNAEGKLQDQEHQIIDADTGKPIETKKSLVVGVVEEKTGMDFDRFTRSILLAQGGFDTFLKADVEQKSKILEQITGTGIYSEISRRVHERLRGEKDALKLLEAETSGIVILGPEQEQELRQVVEEKRRQETRVAAKATEAGNAITWLKTIDSLRQEIVSLDTEAETLQEQVAAFAPEKARLDRAMKAATLEGSYGRLTALRKQQSEDREALTALEQGLPDLEARAQRQVQALHRAEQATAQARQELEAQAPLIRQVRALDQKIAAQARAVSEDEALCVQTEEKIKAGQVRLQMTQTQKDLAQKELTEVETYLREHGEDEWLDRGLAGVEARLGDLLSRQKDIAREESGLTKAQQSLTEASARAHKAREHTAMCRQALEAAENTLQEGRAALAELLAGKLLREYRTEKDTLLREMLYLQKIQALETHRAQLEDGKPCPLCGSLEHPFAEGNTPAPDEIQQRLAVLNGLIDQAEAQEEDIRKQESAVTLARQSLNDSERQEAEIVSARSALELMVDHHRESLARLHASFDDLKQQVSEQLRPLGITDIPETGAGSLLESLQSRLAGWQAQVARKREIEQKIANLHSDLSGLQGIIDTQSTALTEQRDKLARLKKEYQAARDERQQLYGDKQPDAEESRLNQTLARAGETEREARELNSGLQQQLTTTKARISDLQLRISGRAPDLAQAETGFAAELQPAGFASEEDFLAAWLASSEREALQSQARALEESRTRLKAKQKDRADRLASEMARQVTDRSLGELEPELQTIEQTLRELRDGIADASLRLRQNEEARARIREKQSAIEAQRKECLRWEKLHSLIGSADGKKYRNFAQGLTFELMIGHANRQLEKMTDRYLLVRDDEQPLELNVVDNYQAGEIRSTRNLSGGESFIVSLTLALGLSKMASRKVRVDSLFLDEGFGTLDEEALETALETLSGLQQDGKLIGIISHVSALKDRISTRISITPASGGRSTLSGPGCRQLVKNG